MGRQNPYVPHRDGSNEEIGMAFSYKTKSLRGPRIPPFYILAKYTNGDSEHCLDFRFQRMQRPEGRQVTKHACHQKERLVTPSHTSTRSLPCSDDLFFSFIIRMLQSSATTSMTMIKSQLRLELEIYALTHSLSDFLWAKFHVTPDSTLHIDSNCNLGSS